MSNKTLVNIEMKDKTLMEVLHNSAYKEAQNAYDHNSNLLSGLCVSVCEHDPMKAFDYYNQLDFDNKNKFSMHFLNWILLNIDENEEDIFIEKLKSEIISSVEYSKDIVLGESCDDNKYVQDLIHQYQKIIDLVNAKKQEEAIKVYQGLDTFDRHILPDTLRLWLFNITFSNH